MAQTTSLVFNGGVIPSPSPAPSGSGKAKLLKIGEITVTEQEAQVAKNVICDPDSVTTVAPFMEVLTSARLAELVQANNILVLDDGTMQYLMSDASIAVEEGTAVCTAVNFLGLSKENRAKVLYPCTRLTDELTLQQVVEVGEPVETDFNHLLVDGEDSVPKYLEDAIIADEDGLLRIRVTEEVDSTPENPNKVLVLDDSELRDEIDNNAQRITNLEEAIDELDMDSVPHAYLHSTLNHSAGDSSTTRTTIDIFACNGTPEGDCFEFEQTTTIDDTPYGYLWIEPGTYLINGSVTLQWVGDPRGTFVAKVGSVMGENFDFSQEQEILRNHTKIVTVQNRMKLAINIIYDAGTPVMGLWIQSLQVVKLAGGMSQTTVAHDTSLVGSGSVADPLGISTSGMREAFDYAKDKEYFATKQEIAPLATKSALQAETARATQRENEIEALFTLPTQEAVDAWLAAHPEATTTVEDNSITDAKLHPSIKFNRNADCSKLGYKLLSKDAVFSDEVSDENVIYEVRWDFDLDNATCEVPAGCVIVFNGGSVSNGKLIGSNTQVVAGNYQVFNNIDFDGTFITDKPRCEWFGGGVVDSIIDNSQAILSCINAFGRVNLNKGVYKFTSALTLPDYAIIEGDSEGLTSFELCSDIDFIDMSTAGVILKGISFTVRTATYSHKVVTIYGKQHAHVPRVYSRLTELKFNANSSYSLQFDAVAISFESNSHGITEVHADELYINLFGIALDFKTTTNGWINENKFSKIYVRSCPCAVKMRLTGSSTQILSNHFDISYQNDVNFYRATQACIIDVPVNSPSVANNTFNGFFWDVVVNPDANAGGVLKSVGFNSFGVKPYFMYQSGTEWSLLALVPNAAFGVAFDVVASLYYNIKYRFQFTTILSGGVPRLQCNKVENLTSRAFSSQFEFKYVVRNDTIYLFLRKSSTGYFYTELDGQGAVDAPYAAPLASLPADATNISLPNGDIVNVYSSQTLRVAGTEELTGVLVGDVNNITLSGLYSYATDATKASGIKIYRTTASSLGLTGTELITLFVYFAGTAYGGSYGAGSSFIGFGSQAIYRGKIDLVNQTWVVTKMNESAI